MSAEARPTLDVSVVVPLLDEAENVAPLARELHAALASQGCSYELIFVDDGSADGTAAACRGLAGVRLLRHPRTLGQSAATLSGIWAARGETIVTLDGDGQNDPASIPELLAALASHDLAQGIRATRCDSWSRRLASRVAFAARNLLLGDGIVDTGCSLRAFRRREALRLPAFDGLHRLLPALFVFRGLRVAQVATHHRPRRAGVSKYGNARRALRGLVDLIGLWWLKRRLLRGPAAAPHEEPSAGRAPTAAVSVVSRPPAAVRP